MVDATLDEELSAGDVPEAAAAGEMQVIVLLITGGASLEVRQV